MATDPHQSASAATAPYRARRLPSGGDLTGAFADGAILFPLLVALAWETGMAAAAMLATTGLAYMAAAWLFRLPVPVQPLKSLAITAIAVGATVAEIRLAGAVLGGVFLVLVLLDVNRLARRVPAVIVHGIQLGLGVMLVLKALSMVGIAPATLAAVTAASIAVLGLARLTGLPVLGALAVGALAWGLWHATPAGAAAGQALVRPWVLALLVVPQVALSLTNAVLGTERTTRAYFGDHAARRVTPRRLLASLGLGNLAVAAVGGLPFCHGSGGVTAHVHGGSRSAWSNVIIGTTLIALAAAFHYDGGLPAYAPALQATLLAIIGALHMRLARTSWRSAETRPVLLAMGGAALVSQDMLVVLVAGAAVLALRHWAPQGLRRAWHRPITPHAGTPPAGPG